MKMVAEYLEHALTFERMAAAETIRTERQLRAARAKEPSLVKFGKSPSMKRGSWSIAGAATERACTTVTLFAAYAFRDLLKAI
jgi:hypothetical protein